MFIMIFCKTFKKLLNQKYSHLNFFDRTHLKFVYGFLGCHLRVLIHLGQILSKESINLYQLLANVFKGFHETFTNFFQDFIDYCPTSHFLNGPNWSQCVLDLYTFAFIKSLSIFTIFFKLVDYKRVRLKELFYKTFINDYFSFVNSKKFYLYLIFEVNFVIVLHFYKSKVIIYKSFTK